MAILVHGYHSDDQWAAIYLQTQFTSALKALARDLDNCRTFLSVPKNPSEGKDTAESLSADIMDVAVSSSLLSSMAHCPRWGLCTTN